MLYFANPCNSKGVLEAMRIHELGYIDTPMQSLWNRRPPGVIWCADNGCFGSGWPGEDAWLEWLGRNRQDAASCAFATAPDVVGQAEATLERSRPMLPLIRALGYPAALVAQDGLEDLPVPWAEFDALFIGGSTDWKLGPAARALGCEALDRGKRLHMGRVNSGKRFRYARALGCDSADGTFLTFGPDQNLQRMRAWSDHQWPKRPRERKQG